MHRAAPMPATKGAESRQLEPASTPSLDRVWHRVNTEPGACVDTRASRRGTLRPAEESRSSPAPSSILKTPAVTHIRPEVGHVLEERYLLERVIGEGGMGVVFAARHIELGEPVAVKVLHGAEAKDEEHLERFLREARLAARIKNA